MAWQAVVSLLSQSHKERKKSVEVPPVRGCPSSSKKCRRSNGSSERGTRNVCPSGPKDGREITDEKDSLRTVHTGFLHTESPTDGSAPFGSSRRPGVFNKRTSRTPRREPLRLAIETLASALATIVARVWRSSPLKSSPHEWPEGVTKRKSAACRSATKAANVEG